MNFEAKNGNLAPEIISNIAFSFMESRILLTAFELDIFSVIGSKSKTSAEVAKTIKADERAVDRLLNALCALKLVKKEKNKYFNSTSASDYLDKNKPGYMSGLMHSVHMWKSWSTLTDAVRKGGTVGEKSIGKRGDKWLSDFIEAMDWRAVRQAKEVISLIDLSNVSRILDVGGGSGAYSIEFVKAKESLHATVFDLPEVLPFTKKYLKKQNLEGKIDVIPGDYNVDSFGKGFDLVFLSAIIHINSPLENIKLLERSVKALKPGGRVVVQDFIMDKDRTNPVFGTIFALNMIVATESGDTYTESEICGWMQKVGLKDIDKKDTKFGAALLIGSKE